MMQNTLTDANDFLPIIEERFRNGLSVNLIVTGNSMLPFLCDKRDSVCLTEIKNEPKKGDIYLYRRKDGRLVLHRIKKVTEEGIYFIGDSQISLEGPLHKDQLVAECHSVMRKGKLTDENSLIWKFFSHVWLNIIPLRHFICKFIGFFKKF